MFTSYPQVLEYLYRNLPMYQRVGATAFRKDLTNTIALCHALDNPQSKFKSIHVAGTNGKGSSSHMLASVLQSAGYKTGLYTSPHLKEFTERIKLNGTEISQEFVVDFVNRIQEEIEEIRPSFFEITVAMAFDYFASQKVDIAIIEVGLGGRLDSTNVITPEVSLITNIGYDHMDLLGNTLKEIAAEKAGIIKPGVPVVISERQEEVDNVFLQKAGAVGASIHFAVDEYQVTRKEAGFQIFRGGKPLMKDLQLQLDGDYQSKNLAGVMKTIDIMGARGYRVSTETIRSGLEQTVRQTGLKGRWQKLSDKPLIICDTGHNYDGIIHVVRQMKQQSYSRLIVVWGMVREKERELNKILQLLPQDAYYFFCQAPIPRALDAEQLAERAGELGLKGEVVKEVNLAVRSAKQMAGPGDFIFVGGSTYVVAEIEDL